MKNILLILLTILWLMPYTAMTQQIQRFTESDGLPQSVVTCVLQDSKGYIWLSSWNGLSRYDGYSFTPFKARQGDNCPLKTNRILFISETKNGNILCKCKEGFYLFDTKTRKFVALPDKKSDKGDRFRPTAKQKAAIGKIPEYRGIEFRLLYIDRQGGYWVYTHKGLDRVTPERKRIAPVKYCGNGEEFIRSIFRDSRGRLFVADKNGFVRITDNRGNFVGYLASSGNITKTRTPFGANVYSMFQDSRGFIWMGSKPNGLFRLTNSKNGGFIVKSFKKGNASAYALNCNNIYSMAEDRQGRIILGTYRGGLNIIENPWSDSPRFINSGNALRGYPKSAMLVHSIHITGDDALVIGTNDGLFTCSLKDKNTAMRFYANKRVPSGKTSLGNNQVMDVLEAHDGTLYVATYGGGLNIMTSDNILSDNIRFKALTTDNGMASDVVLSLCEDGNGKIWCVSEHCVMEYDPRKKTFSNYMGSLFADGFSFSEVNPFFDRRSGLMLFGTTQGLLSLNTVDGGKSRFVPRIVFDAPDFIDLQPEDKSLSISFSALDYNKNEQIHYAYKLEGIDKDWLYTNENRINLSNIPAGTFRLKVRSTNGDGIWCDNEAELTIHRTAFFSETPFAWMLYGCLLVVVVIFVWKLTGYIRKLKKEIEKLKLSGDESMEYVKLKLGEIIEKKDETKDRDLKNTGSIEKNEFKTKVEDFMRKNVADPDLSVNSFAQEMGVSRSVLYIQMKEQLGCTPNNYIQGFRIDMAYRLLKEDSSLNISDIAYRCGFSDPKYFSRCFKKVKGFTPSEAR